MPKVIIVDNSTRDAERVGKLLARDGAEAELCQAGAAAAQLLASAPAGFAAVFILWELAGPPVGAELLALCRTRWPQMPVVVMSGSLDASLATRAFALGARDFLEKPVEEKRLRGCLQRLLATHPETQEFNDLRQQLIGESPAWLATLREVVKVMAHADARVMLIGESGTGKELLAQAIHRNGARAEQACVAVNVGEIPATLIESVLFGHERGAFTNAVSKREGLLEEAGEGTLFLDEIGDLAVDLQGKLLRVIQEKKFRRVGGKVLLDFKARIIAATNRDLAAAVTQGAFRRDLYHRLAEVTIQLPPLRERKGDVELLLRHFLERNGGVRVRRLSREALTILRSYPFHGNVRELENLIKGAVIACDGDTVLPHHLPLQSMGTFLNTAEVAPANPPTDEGVDPERQALQREVAQSLPARWLEMSYREAMQFYVQAFDRRYLPYKLARAHHNITQAAKDAGIDVKTFRKRWEDAGLSPLSAKEGSDE
ncbi:MAG: sigma 54-interacting transcriptional regulator [Acidobacteria bacterium]|nr:sigma 54-interacting transcriptional regulator [Acidobacteriota bacterium]MBI3421334.1 sigma 54-interacting transcriptional regulator [Acidobacteriota bacterium]